MPWVRARRALSFDAAAAVSRRARTRTRARAMRAPSAASRCEASASLERLAATATLWSCPWRRSKNRTWPSCSAVVQLGLGSQMDLYVHVEQAGVITTGPSANCQPPAAWPAFRSVLLVGEGDFSFAAALAPLASTSSKIVATTVQSEAEVRAAHPSQSPQALAALRDVGAQLRFKVDARRLDEHFRGGPAFDCIVWNLPFASDVAPGNSVKTDPNKALMRGFFAAVVRCVEGWSLRTPTVQMPTVLVSVGISQFADWGAAHARP